MDPQAASVTPVSPSNTPQDSKNMYVAIIIGVLLLFVVFIGMIFMKGSSTGGAVQTQNANNQQETVKPQINVKGSMTLQSSVMSIPTGQPVILTLIADSANEVVSGYDTLITYDPTAFEFSKGKSNLKDFSLYTFNRSSHITITAIKALQSTESTVFTESPVATLTFTPKKSGKFSFSIKQQIGKETTSFVTTQSMRYSPAESSLSISVQ